MPDGQLQGFAIVNPKYSTLGFDLLSYQDQAAILSEMIACATEPLRQTGSDTIRIQCRDDNQLRRELLARLRFTAEPVGTLHLRLGGLLWVM